MYFSTKMSKMSKSLTIHQTLKGKKKRMYFIRAQNRVSEFKHLDYKIN